MTCLLQETPPNLACKAGCSDNCIPVADHNLNMIKIALSSKFPASLKTSASTKNSLYHKAIQFLESPKITHQTSRHDPLTRQNGDSCQVSAVSDKATNRPPRAGPAPYCCKTGKPSMDIVEAAFPPLHHAWPSLRTNLSCVCVCVCVRACVRACVCVHVCWCGGVTMQRCTC